MASGDSDIYRGEMRQDTPLNVALCKLWYRIWQLTGFSASGSGVVGLTVLPKQYTTPSNFVPVTTNGNAVTILAGEVGFIQNLDDAAVYVKYGAEASASDFNFVLKAGTASNDGLGGLVVIDNFIGTVSIFAATGAPRVAAWKLS